ncbi:hypothetical protein ABIE26_002974 [Pedobacter africanus]|uniref:hypothetical protein n=1 Tax=Pedobacter africanus TaxID=151894 RepID=UPI0033936681
MMKSRVFEEGQIVTFMLPGGMKTFARVFCYRDKLFLRGVFEDPASGCRVIDVKAMRRTKINVSYDTEDFSTALNGIADDVRDHHRKLWDKVCCGLPNHFQKKHKVFCLTEIEKAVKPKGECQAAQPEGEYKAGQPKEEYKAGQIVTFRLFDGTETYAEVFSFKGQLYFRGMLADLRVRCRVIPVKAVPYIRGNIRYSNAEAHSTTTMKMQREGAEIHRQRWEMVCRDISIHFLKDGEVLSQAEMKEKAHACREMKRKLMRRKNN